MQTITTKFHPPGNVRGSRVSAKAHAGRISLSWDHSKNPEDNHKAAALAFMAKMQWGGRMIGGETFDNTGWVWVFDNDLSPSIERKQDGWLTRKQESAA